jgi:hypothetical protein
VRTSWLIALVWVGGFVQFASLAQGTAEDYRRAAGLRDRFERRVFRDRIRVHWLGETGRGWYRVETDARSHEYIVFDAVNGRRAPAFDHAALAEALQTMGIPDVTATGLPLQGLKFDLEEREAQFRCGDGSGASAGRRAC